jgi:cell division protein FtsB
MMSVAMLIMLVTLLGIVGGAAFAGYMIGRNSLPPGDIAFEDARLAKQMERIELLEAEISRLRDQADFTEKLLEERGTPDEPPEG